MVHLDMLLSLGLSTEKSYWGTALGTTGDAFTFPDQHTRHT